MKQERKRMCWLKESRQGESMEIPCFVSRADWMSAEDVVMHLRAWSNFPAMMQLLPMGCVLHPALTEASSRWGNAWSLTSRLQCSCVHWVLVMLGKYSTKAFPKGFAESLRVCDFLDPSSTSSLGQTRCVRKCWKPVGCTQVTSHANRANLSKGRIKKETILKVWILIWLHNCENELTSKCDMFISGFPLTPLAPLLRPTLFCVSSSLQHNPQSRGVGLF